MSIFAFIAALIVGVVLAFFGCTIVEAPGEDAPSQNVVASELVPLLSETEPGAAFSAGQPVDAHND